MVPTNRRRAPAHAANGPVLLSSPLPAAAGALLLALALTACGGEAGSAPVWEGSVRDSAGIRIVENPARGIWTDESRWHLHEELRIGVAEGDPELQFGSVTGLDVDAEGHIWVLDNQASRIRVFDAEGTLLRAFGRRGQGPGELSQQAMGLFVGPDGAALVADMANQRMVRVDAQGEPLETRPIDLTAGIPMLYGAGGDGGIYQQVRLMSLPGMAPIEGGPRDYILALRPDGSIADTVAELVSGTTFEFGEGGMPTIRIFSPENVWAVTTGGQLVTGVNSTYSLALREPGGEPTTILRRESARRAVTDSDQRSFRDAMRRAWTDAGMPEAVAAQMEQGVQFEPNWPALAALIPGPEGTLWVQRVDPEGALDPSAFEDLQNFQFGSRGWDVFDREGRYLGILEMPEGFTPRRVVDNAVYGIHTDDLGIQRVARYRIARGGA
jgi:hypothetical protein